MARAEDDDQRRQQKPSQHSTHAASVPASSMPSHWLKVNSHSRSVSSSLTRTVSTYQPESAEASCPMQQRIKLPKSGTSRMNLSVLPSSNAKISSGGKKIDSVL